ncbi:BET1-like protein [Balamuthia mandrillaris]
MTSPFARGQARQSRSLLLGGDGGGPRDRERDLLQAQTDQLLEEDNDRYLTNMVSKIGFVKELAQGIQGDIRESNSLLEQMESGIQSTGVMLKGTATRLTEMTKTATTKQMLAFIGVVVIIFFCLWYLLNYYLTSK